MCDTFVALPPVTLDRSLLFGKSADCQVNEAHAVVRVERRAHLPGEAFRATHIVIPQVAETYSVLLSKSFWTFGCEMGVNEHGLVMGNEAVFTMARGEERRDGLIGMDLMRLALERARTCREAIDVIGRLLCDYGQGGNCELSGNSHFDCSFILADTAEAWVLETAGRDWAAKQLSAFQSISNAFVIGNDWDLSSVGESSGQFDWAAVFGDQACLPAAGARERQRVTHCSLEAEVGSITLNSAFKLLRQHGPGYHPARGEVATNICAHAGPSDQRQWQATGAMVTQTRPEGTLAWVTGTSGTCVSIFKPVFVEAEWAGIGPLPAEQYDPQSLWWKHELLHRRAMAGFDAVVPEIRAEFDVLEQQFISSAQSVLTGTQREKQQVMEYCFQTAERATEQWSQRLGAMPDLAFADPAYQAMWQKYNDQASIPEAMPPLRVGR
jgi:secernin